MTAQPKPYFPRGYAPPVPQHGRLVTMTNVVIGGALQRGEAANDPPPFHVEPRRVDGLTVFLAGALALISGAVGVLFTAMAVLVGCLLLVYAFHSVADGARTWSSWAEYRSALTGMTDSETLLLAGCTAVSLLPLLLLGRRLFNARTKGPQ